MLCKIEWAVKGSCPCDASEIIAQQIMKPRKQEQLADGFQIVGNKGFGEQHSSK